MNALSDITVYDRSGTVAGQFCGKLLADFGAEVWLEQPDGTPPDICPGGAPGSPLDIHLNLLKRRGAPSGADVVLCAPGDDPEDMRARHPRVIAVKITGFGDDGPKAGWRAPEIVLQAHSGMMISNGIRGRSPLYGTGQRASYAAGQAAYVQTLASLRARRQGAGGDTVRIDAAETAAAMCFPYVLQAIYNGTDRRRGDQDIPAGEVKCRGAWVCLWVYSNRFKALCEELGLEECLTDPRFAEVEARQQNWRAFFNLMQEKVDDRDPDGLVAKLQGMNIIAARAYRISELRESEHLAARGYWREVRIDGETLVLPGAPFRLSETPARNPQEAGDAAA